MQKRIFVDVSYIIRHDIHTGIQRVVKEITRAFAKERNRFEVELIPFKFASNCAVRVPLSELTWLSQQREIVEENSDDSLAMRSEHTGPVRVTLDVLRNLFYRSKVSIANFVRNEHFSHLLLGSAREKNSLNYFLTLGLLHKPLSDASTKEGIEIDFREGDVVLLLDSSWDVQNFADHLARLGGREARLVSIMYDVIPLSHAQFVVPGLASAFRRSLKAIVRHADQIISISASELTVVKKFVVEFPEYKERVRPLEFGYFHLGCNLPEGDKGGPGLKLGLPDHFLTLKTGGLDEAYVFLCVGTVEPRKNIDLVLDAFFQVWLKRRDVILVLVGKPGWKTEKLQARISDHPLTDTCLFWSSKLNDSGLTWLYRNSDYLLQASITEGFGLPLVEAMVSGKQILCSDIPVFHEVAGEKATYFDPTDPQSLAAKVNALANKPKPSRDLVIDRSAWINWDESAQQLLNQIYRTD
jgi:O-antigen biosynthesis alpha-1,2-rhamnosyltransferase